MYFRLALVAMNMFKDFSDHNVNRMDSKQEIISRLKFIGKIKTGEKINTRRMYVQPDSLRTSLSRTFIHHDNRGNALNFVQETIQRGFELLTNYERSDKKSDRALFRNLIADLRQAEVGLKNLKHTYKDDVKFCCDMDTLLEGITAKLARYDDLESGLASGLENPLPGQVPND